MQTTPPLAGESPPASAMVFDADYSIDEPVLTLQLSRAAARELAQRLDALANAPVNTTADLSHLVAADPVVSEFRRFTVELQPDGFETSLVARPVPTYRTDLIFRLGCMTALAICIICGVFGAISIVRMLAPLFR